MDNGYQDWKEKKEKISKKRIHLFLKIGIGILALSIFVFFFGYEEEMFAKHKITEFLGGVSALFLLGFGITFLIYKVPKYVPICNTCGRKIKSIKKDCFVGNVECIGTVDKTVYENVTSTIKGETVYKRGGYAMQNSTLEKTSESTYEVKTRIPLVKKFYIYKIEYCCKSCKSLFCTEEEERVDPLRK